MVLASLLTGAAGCGSGARNPDGGGGGQGGAAGAPGGAGGAVAAGCVADFPAGASVFWREDGVGECAKEVQATYFTQGFLEVDGSTGTGPSVGFQVLAHGTTLGGSYACATGTNPPEPYAVFFPSSGMAASCTVTIENPGAPGGPNVTGTFSAAVTLGGATIAITDGRFDTPLM